ncbi:uncharacterized [Tachysurus ichikawai]
MPHPYDRRRKNAGKKVSAVSAFRHHLATLLSLKHDCRLHPLPPTSLCVIKVFDLSPSLQSHTHFHTRTRAAATLING